MRLLLDTGVLGQIVHPLVSEPTTE